MLFLIYGLPYMPYVLFYGFLVFAGTFPDYTPLQAIVDERSGRVVEVGKLENMSSLCVALSVFRDLRAERSRFASADQVFHTCGLHDWDRTRLTFEDGCYVLTISRHSRYDFTPIWKDWWNGHEICFRIYEIDERKQRRQILPELAASQPLPSVGR